jgi:hypothetical protein
MQLLTSTSQSRISVKADALTQKAIHSLWRPFIRNRPFIGMEQLDRLRVSDTFVVQAY